MATQGERISSLETEMRLLKLELTDMNRKLDDLLILRYKGAGAFWLAATLVGTGIIGALTQVIQWMRG